MESGFKMPKLTVLKGLPGSGKSTLARARIADSRNTVRVNKDLLREMLYFLPKNWSGNISHRPVLEKPVQKAEMLLAEYFISLGFDVIVDDTNLKGSFISVYKDLADKHKANFELVGLTVPVEICIERDKSRPLPVGEQVIRNMAKSYNKGD